MLKSMTGFGRSKYENDSREYIVEIKSVNNRFLDFNPKYPRIFTALDDVIRRTVSNKVKRGKLDLFINFEKQPVHSALIRSFRQMNTVQTVIEMN